MEAIKRCKCNINIKGDKIECENGGKMKSA